MALLEFEDGRSTTDLNEICEVLSVLGIELSRWSIADGHPVRSLLKKPTLTDLEKTQVLTSLDDRFELQRKRFGYQTRDLVVLHPEVPNLDGLLAQFDKVHTHDDDEVRYIVDGSGSFGFLRPDGSQILLTVEAEEYIRVPKDTKHWFILDSTKRIKAVRYFTNQTGWAAKYTGDKVNL